MTMTKSMSTPKEDNREEIHRKVITAPTSGAVSPFVTTLQEIIKVYFLFSVWASVLFME